MRFLTTEGKRVAYEFGIDANIAHGQLKGMQVKSLTSAEFLALLQDAVNKNIADGMSIEQCARILWPDNMEKGGNHGE
jgi:hypothetical protein